MKKTRDIFSENFKARFKYYQYTPEEFSHLTGIKASIIEKYVNGKKDIPTKHVQAIATGLGVPAEVLFSDPDNKLKNKKVVPFHPPGKGWKPEDVLSYFSHIKLGGIMLVGYDGSGEYIFMASDEMTVERMNILLDRAKMDTLNSMVERMLEY